MQANVTRHVRAILRGDRHHFLVLLDNRTDPSHLTVTVPGREVLPSETPVESVARALRDQAGVTLPSEDCARFLLSRTYESRGDGEVSEVGYFVVDIDHAVPMNVCPEKILTVGWMTPAQVAERVGPVSSDSWKVQLGLTEAAFGGGDPREVARVDAPRDPRVAAVPFGGVPPAQS
jgi:ADP-ribose pyrophosphatase YjhB (NUDIX family)